MKLQTIRFVSLREKFSTAEGVNEYQFRDDRPARWLQRLCCAILKRLGAYRRIENVSIREKTINLKKFNERVLAQYDQLEMLYNERPRKMYIGSQDYREAMHEEAVEYEPLRFTTQYFCQKNGHEYCFGLEVHVIPWMRGILVVP